MSSSISVIATGNIRDLRRYSAEDETPICVVMEISVTSMRRVDGTPAEELDVITVTTIGEQAANCSEFLHAGQSIGVQADLFGSPKHREGFGCASAAIFIGPNSRVAPFRAPNAEALAAMPELEPTLSA